MSICLTWFPIGGYRRTQYLPEFGRFYKKWEDCGGVIDNWMIAQRNGYNDGV